jgi:hypothetical protein
MKSGSSARRQAALLILEAELAIDQNDKAYQKPLKELHNALLPAFLKTFDFSVLRDLHPDSFSKSIGDPRFLNPNSRNSMIQKYLTSGGCGLMARLFVDALCREGACILSDHAKSNAPHIAAIAKNLPYVSGFEYAPWNICRAISLNDYGGLIETRPRIPAPNTPDIDVWMTGALNLDYFNTLVTERMEPESRSRNEEETPRDSGAFRFIAKTILDYARFERALRKVMMSLAPEAFVPTAADN